MTPQISLFAQNGAETPPPAQDAAETPARKPANRALGAGADLNGAAVHSVAPGGILFFERRLPKNFSAGVQARASGDFEGTFALEGSAFARYYILTIPKLLNLSLFAELGAGCITFFYRGSDYEEGVYPAPVAAGAAGVRISPLPFLGVEASVRGGYPAGYGVSVCAVCQF